MPLYMLDTDTVSCVIRGQTPLLDARVAAVPKKHLCISAVTRGELLYGVKLKEGAQRLAKLIDAVLLRLPCLS
jgi:tRNA(fMet)-specific endonuclease VapC